MKRILSVKIHRDVDTDPDTSWIGKYACNYGYKDVDGDPLKNKVIDRQERGDMGRGQYRYFVAANSGADTGNPDSVEQDYQRIESLNAGQWSFIGIWAEAHVQLDGSSVVQRLRSDGLWGIESDSDDSHLESVEQEEIANLRDELATVGFTADEIDAAIADKVEVRQ